MKIFIKLMVLILVLGLAGPFILKKPNGEPWMDWRNIVEPIQSTWRSLNSGVDSVVNRVTPSQGETEVYKWRGADGSWVYSDTPPPEGEVETLRVDPNTNLIQGLPEQEETPPEEEKVADKPAESAMPIMPNPVKLIEDAKGVQDLMNQRNRQLESAASEN